MRLHDRLPQETPKQAKDPPIEVSHFQVVVPNEGYCWLTDAQASPMLGDENQKKLGAGPYMVVKGFVDGAGAVMGRRSFPLQETPDLFSRFRDLDLDGDSILTFANRYGWIGGTGSVDHRGRALIEAVGIDTWRSNIREMILVDHLWDCVQKDDRPTLRKYLKWHPTKFDVWMSVRFRNREIHSVDQGPHSDGSTDLGKWLLHDVDGELFRRTFKWYRGDVIGPARLAMMRIVNSQLAGLCHPRLYLDPHRGLTGRWTPVNLLGCIWLQFYLMVLGELKLRNCAVCGKVMDVSESRSTKRMHERCSKNKRMRDWRKTRAARLVLQK